MSQQIAVLKRMKKLLPLKLRENLYRAFIAPHFNYCAESWHFCGNRLTENLEKLNERALRFVYQDKNCPYETLIVKNGSGSNKSARNELQKAETHPCQCAENSPCERGLFSKPLPEDVSMKEMNESPPQHLQLPDGWQAHNSQPFWPRQFNTQQSRFTCQQFVPCISSKVFLILLWIVCGYNEFLEESRGPMAILHLYAYPLQMTS